MRWSIFSKLKDWRVLERLVQGKFQAKMLAVRAARLFIFSLITNDIHVLRRSCSNSRLCFLKSACPQKSNKMYTQPKNRFCSHFAQYYVSLCTVYFINSCPFLFWRKCKFKSSCRNRQFFRKNQRVLCRQISLQKPNLVYLFIRFT